MEARRFGRGMAGASPVYSQPAIWHLGRWRPRRAPAGDSRREPRHLERVAPERITGDAPSLECVVGKSLLIDARARATAGTHHSHRPFTRRSWPRVAFDH